LGNLQEMLENALTGIRKDLIEVSEKFHPQLNGLLKGEIDAESNILLQERVKKAGEYFSVRLEAALKGIPARNSVESDNKTVRKSVSESLERIRKECVIKLACLNAVRQGFIVSKYLDARAKSVIDIPEVKSHSEKSVDDTSGIIEHPVLFRQLKEWRNTKAVEMNLPHYMILQQKTMVTLANFVPQSMAALHLVKGMGMKKSEKFGEELLNIIISFCRKENIEPPAETLVEKKIPKKIKEDR
jgi:superfamily II DNA helicase RecQ